MGENNSQNEDRIFQLKMGAGTWAWGDRLMWGYGRDYGDAEIKKAFDECLADGINLFDTAEVYAQGRSEKYLGRFIQETDRSKIYIATKFMPFPWRLSRAQLFRAVKASLRRLEIKKIDLYQIHMPLPPLSMDIWLEAMVDAMQAGLITGIGVSNFNSEQLQSSYEFLARHGVKLISNQIEYNILNRQVERDGLLKVCDDLGVRVIAYSPLAQGLLTGKYTPENLPGGIRGRKYPRKLVVEIQPLLSLLRRIGANYAGKNTTQIALNWLMCKNTLPIPGVKNDIQVQQVADALGWNMTDEEIALIDRESEKIQMNS